MVRQFNILKHSIYLICIKRQTSNFNAQKEWALLSYGQTEHKDIMEKQHL